MDRKLEDKLSLYEKSSPINNDRELIDVLEDIIDKENARPAAERDFDLIDEAVEMLLTLKGTDVASLDSIAEKLSEHYVEEIKAEAFTSKNRKINAKRLFKIIPIAAVIALFVSTSLAAGAAGYDFFGEALDWIKAKIYGSGDVGTVGSFNEYDTLEELASAAEYSYALLPTELPEGYTVTKITAQTSYVEESKDRFRVYRMIDVRMLYDGKLQTLSIEDAAESNTPAGSTEQIGSYSVSVMSSVDRCTGSFIHEGNVYTFTASSRDNLESMICSLK